MTDGTRPLEAGDLDRVAELWNASLGTPHPLGRRALEAWWASPDTDPALTFGVEQAGRVCGVLLARAPERSFVPHDVGFVSLLAVEPGSRGQGLGSTLWRAAMAALGARGRRRVRLGTEPDHLLPGVPAAVDDASWRFLLARGVRPGRLETDLHLDLRRGPPTLPCRLPLVSDAETAVLRFVARTFPGRWAEELPRYAEHGVALLALIDAGSVVGFAAAFGPDDALLGPSLTWAPAVQGRPGGLGPLGIDPAYRGRGLGLELVAAAARWHHARGTQDLIINWTTLTEFYGRLGARVWRAYQRAELALQEPAATTAGSAA